MIWQVREQEQVPMQIERESYPELKKKLNRLMLILKTTEKICSQMQHINQRREMFNQIQTYKKI